MNGTLQKMIHYYLSTLLMAQGEKFGGKENAGTNGKTLLFTEQVAELARNVDIRELA